MYFMQDGDISLIKRLFGYAVAHVSLGYEDHRDHRNQRYRTGCFNKMYSILLLNLEKLRALMPLCVISYKSQNL